MQQAATLWVFSPCYLDLQSFLKVRQHMLDAIHLELPNAFQKINFILVDDTGDQDPELKNARLPQDIAVISPPFNLGHQRALVYGLRREMRRIAEDDFIITIDSDGEDKPEDTVRLLRPLIENPGEKRNINVAWRTRRRESLLFKIMYFFYKLLFVAFTGQVIRSGNFAAFRGWTIQHVISHPYFDLCYSSSLLSLNLKIHPVPCERGVRFHGKSRMNFQKLVLHGIRMLMPFLDRISTRALLCFSALSAFGFLAALAAVLVRVLTPWGIPGWATYTLLLTLLISITSLGHFIILITIVAQSQGIALSKLEKDA